MLNGRDVLGAEVGSVRVGFAKVPGKPAEDAFPGEPFSEGYANAVASLDHLKGASAIPAERQATAGNLDNYRSPLVTDLLGDKHAQQQNVLDEQHLAGGMPAPPGVSALALSHTRSASHSGLSASNSIVPSSDKGGVPLPAELQPRPSVTDLQLLMEHLSAQDSNEEQESHLAAVRQFRPPATYYTSIPLVSEINNPRRFDSTKLRDMRKGIESGQYSQADIDNIASSFLESIVDLASDYIGNTVVQKFFEKCSEPIKTALLQRIAPHLAMIGIHKNGTWSAQKIIDMAQTPEQRSLIAQHLRPYIPPLLLDQFGNYVVQCLLPYGSFAEAGEQRTGSDFIIDAMTDRCWEIAQGRFGARSMRACLESPRVTRLQCKRVAIAIILNSVPLATSPNGSLLLTWLLDASELPGRFRLLAPRFMPHLTHLCTHKLASLTVLRLVNQNAEPEAATRIMETLFESPNDATLEEILTDQVHGSQFVTKVLQSPHIDLSRRDGYCEQVKRIVREHRLTSVPAYRKLVEDLGLPFQPSAGGSHMYGNGNGAQHSGSGVPVARAGYPAAHATSPLTSHAPPHGMSSIANGLTGYPTSTAPRYGSQPQQQQYSTTSYAQSPSQAPHRHFAQQHDQHFRDAFNPWPSMSSSPASTGGYNTGSPTPMRMGGRSPAKTPPAPQGGGGGANAAGGGMGRGGYVATTGY
jgi:protein JSN1